MSISQGWLILPIIAMAEQESLSTDEEVDSIADGDEDVSYESTSLVNVLRYLIQGAQSGNVSVFIGCDTVILQCGLHIETFVLHS